MGLFMVSSGVAGCDDADDIEPMADMGEDVPFDERRPPELAVIETDSICPNEHAADGEPRDIRQFALTVGRPITRGGIVRAYESPGCTIAPVVHKMGPSILFEQVTLDLSVPGVQLRRAHFVASETADGLDGASVQRLGEEGGDVFEGAVSAGEHLSGTLYLFSGGVENQDEPVFIRHVPDPLGPATRYPIENGWTRAQWSQQMSLHIFRDPVSDGFYVVRPFETFIEVDHVAFHAETNRFRRQRVGRANVSSEDMPEERLKTWFVESVTGGTSRLVPPEDEGPQIGLVLRSPESSSQKALVWLGWSGNADTGWEFLRSRDRAPYNVTLMEWNSAGRYRFLWEEGHPIIVREAFLCVDLDRTSEVSEDRNESCPDGVLRRELWRSNGRAVNEGEQLVWDALPIDVVGELRDVIPSAFGLTIIQRRYERDEDELDGIVERSEMAVFEGARLLRIVPIGNTGQFDDPWLPGNAVWSVDWSVVPYNEVFERLYPFRPCYLATTNVRRFPRPGANVDPYARSFTYRVCPFRDPPQ